MKLISLKSLKVGEKLSTAIRMQDGRVLLPANVTITDTYIKRLKSFGITCVYISDEYFDEVEVRPCISDETKTMALSAVASVYKQLAANKPIDETSIKRVGKEIVSEIRSAMSEPINLFNTYAVNDPRCLHAINVACITAALAMEHGCTPIAVEGYTLAALLHDIKLDSMQEDANIEHAEEACEYLKRTRAFDARTYMSVAMHHEKYDGTGGPKKLKGDTLYEGARILAVADFYDNITHGYGCKSLSLHHAVEYLNMEAGKSLDPYFIKLFNGSVAIYPTGATVLLDNGYKAVVVGQNEKMPTRPKVRLAMKKREDCLLFNLLTQRTMFIENVDL